MLFPIEPHVRRALEVRVLSSVVLFHLIWIMQAFGDYEGHADTTGLHRDGNDAVALRTIWCPDHHVVDHELPFM